MKTLVKLIILLAVITGYSQNPKVDYKKLDNDLVQATYYFTDNDSQIEKVGFFNKEGKIHGIWTSYDKDGHEKVIAQYNNGIKEGLWTYYTEDKIKLVTYKKNKVVQFEEKQLIQN